MKLVIADTLNDKTEALIYSLEQSEIECEYVILGNEDQLSDNIHSPFAFFTGIKDTGKRGLYFNEVIVPHFYEIRSQSGTRAQILSGDKVCGYVNYFKGGKRIAQQVDWLDDKGKKRFSDCYTKTGFRYALLTYTASEKPAQKIYYNTQGEEVITRDMIHQTITMKYNEEILFFDSLTNFSEYYIRLLVKQQAIAIDEIYINSLGYPLFIANALKVKTTLFWQENMGDEIPGNMKAQLEQKRMMNRIVFESTAEQQKVKEKYPSTHVSLEYLSPMYEIHKTVKNKHKGLIITGSDRIPFIEKILAEFPKLEFTIAAQTEMSGKLLTLKNDYTNLTLAPNASDDQLEDLLKQQTFYFDFNEGAEINNCVLRAFKQNSVVIGLDRIAKNKRFELTYTDNEIERLFSIIDQALKNKGKYKELRNTLHEKEGPLSRKKDYIALLG